MTLTTILIILLILMLVGAMPHWGYSSGWGYNGVGVIGAVLLVLVILMLMGKL